MAEAKTPSASYLPGEDPDIVEANRRYQLALQELTSSLDNRKRMFDPTLLAMAQGFLAPTQTGGFGESLSYVAKNVGAAQEAEEKRNQELLEKKLGVASQGLELQRLKARDAELAKYLGEGEQKPPAGPLAGPQAGATTVPQGGPLSAAAKPYAKPTEISPSQWSSEDVPDWDRQSISFPSKFDANKYLTQPQQTGALPGAAPAAPSAPEAPTGAGPLTAAVKTVAPQSVTKAPLSTGDKPPGFEGVEGIQVAPANPNFMSARDYIRLNRFDKSKSPGDLIKEGQEIEQKRYRDKEGGVLDLATGKYYQYPTGKTEEIQLYGYPGTYKVDARTAAQLSLYAANNDPKYHDLAERVVKGPERRKTEGEKPAEGGKPGEPPRLKSLGELELESEKKKALQKADVDIEVAARKDFDQRKREADETITTANLFRKFASEPNAKSMFGILNDEKISSGIATLVRDGVGIPGFTVGTKSIEDIMRNARLSAQDQAKYRTFLTYAAMMQLQASKYMKGAVSDNEQRLLATAGINAQDTPETIRMKADLLTRRAQFDRRVAKAFKDSKMSADEFLDSDRYMEMRDKYNEDLAELASGSKILVPPAKPAAPAAGGNQPSPGFIQDPKTGVYRKKLPGE